MKLGYAFLEDVLSRNNFEISEMAEKLGLTVQAIQGWKIQDKVPPKRVSQIAEMFKLSNQEVDRLLGNKPLHYEFKTREGKEIPGETVSEQMKSRTEMIYERFFESGEAIGSYDLGRLKENIKVCGEDFIKIAQAIRSEFEFSSYRPLTYENLNAIYDRIKVKTYYLPFSAVDLASEQTAILFSKNSLYSVLVNSERTIDEAHFDKLHELIHIFFEDAALDSDKVEGVINATCGELIYPKSYIVEVFFDKDENSKPIKNKEKIASVFYEETKNFTFILSPKGLARAMRDSGLTSKNSELFKYIYNELHDQFRTEYTFNYSKLGKMEIDFSDRKQLLNFYKGFETTVTRNQYPLFTKLKKDLLMDRLSPSDFADTFKLRTADALIIKKIWLDEASNEITNFK